METGDHPLSQPHTGVIAVAMQILSLSALFHIERAGVKATRKTKGA